ncbi:hypothetical protein N431DRAFT_495493 [Stipitochalara longipes BDJ]|nr:hypothetical protein N431DRAFT_495493 [Stipitochalara longipes BDJ]
MKLSIIALPILASYAAASIGDLCGSGGQYGTCEKNSWCNANEGTHDIFNLCPDDPPDVMCCFGPICHNNMGYCDITSNGEECEDSGGSFVAGFCPGPNNYKCCVYSPDKKI